MSKGVRMLTVGEFRALFGEESQCAEQFTRQRWPDGFRCPRCDGATRGYIASRQVHECKRCAYQCSVTAGTIFHKTRTPLTSWFWAIASHGIRASMSRKGNCWDNACSETLFGSLKVERLHGMEFKTHREAKDATLEWLLWYNGKTMHSTLRYLSPTQFEQQAIASPLALAA